MDSSGLSRPHSLDRSTTTVRAEDLADTDVLRKLAKITQQHEAVVRRLDAVGENGLLVEH